MKKDDVKDFLFESGPLSVLFWGFMIIGGLVIWWSTFIPKMSMGWGIFLVVLPWFIMWLITAIDADEERKRKEEEERQKKFEDWRNRH